jgi:hypothetical protein
MHMTKGVEKAYSCILPVLHVSNPKESSSLTCWPVHKHHHATGLVKVWSQFGDLNAGWLNSGPLDVS